MCVFVLTLFFHYVLCSSVIDAMFHSLFMSSRSVSLPFTPSITLDNESSAAYQRFANGY